MSVAIAPGSPEHMRMIENWRPVVGWEGYYEVSDMGRVRSVDRVITQVGRWGIVQRNLKGQMIRPTGVRIDSAHVAVDLAAGGRANRTRRLVHHLVLEAFVGPCPPGMEGCHANDIGDDNRLMNLRWDTKNANQQDKVRNGRHHYAKRTHCDNGHEFSAENTYQEPGSNRRRCRICQRNRAAAIRDRPGKREQIRKYQNEWRANRRANGVHAS